MKKSRLRDDGILAVVIGTLTRFTLDNQFEYLRCFSQLSTTVVFEATPSTANGNYGVHTAHFALKVECMNTKLDPKIIN